MSCKSTTPTWPRCTSGALQGVERIELQFPKFTDGRAYSQALLLRRRYQFAGDIRATGDVLIDQLVHMHRSGFSSAVLAGGVDASAAERQFARFCCLLPGRCEQAAPTRCPGGRMSAVTPANCARQRRSWAATPPA